MKHYLITVTLNFLAVVLLIGLIVAPLYFAKSFTKVSGVKSQSKFLIVSQVEKFPNMVLSQKKDTYTISFRKQGSSQVYLSVLIVNNPTETTQTYSLDVISGTAEPFFGRRLEDRPTKITVPQGVSIPLSLYSPEKELSENQMVQFKITAEGG